ncbi:glycoside hydrolase family 2 [Bacteroides sp. 519]|nr:glycoside hydrolase family 2 [Bacteroides sp. 519]
MLADNDWKVQSSEKATAPGSEISTPNATVSNWYNGFVPSTIMGVLTQNGLYKDVLTGLNYKEIDRTPFNCSWWYRKEFTLPLLTDNQHARIHFDGISYYANVWLNGVQIASRNELYGPFRQFSFDVTPYLAENNTLAVEVFRAQPGDPNIGFVDWNPRPADESMGIFREVYLEVFNVVEMKNTYVHSKVNTQTLDEAWLTVETTLKNYSDKKVKGKLLGQYEEKEFTIPVLLEAGEEKVVKLTSEEVEELYIENPRIWWCNNLGTPEMYELKLQFETDGKISDSDTIPFGIREIKDYFITKDDRGFMLNGKKVLIKSAGWTDDIFLRDTPVTNEIQVQYVKDMNMNSIRLENIWGTSQNIYDLCDKYGLLVLVGWSCQWEWKNHLGGPVDKYGGIKTEKDMELIANSFRDQVVWLRNHPSIIAWYVGSDMTPRPALEEKYLKVLKEVDRLRPYVAAASKRNSSVTGSTGMKMNGPYEYVGPNYWYEDNKYGGAFGFNTETGIGAQLPVIESLKKMIPEDKLWPLNEYWDYHCTRSMKSLDILTETIEKKYGKATDLNDYLRKANLLNYEGTKAMFEAFRVNVPKTTGIVQWMLNSAWPSLYWQVYDYYLIPTAAYYGIKRGNMPQQLIYNYKDNGIYYVNEGIVPVERKARIALYGPDSQLIQEANIDFRVEVDLSKKVFQLDSIAANVFLALELYDKEGAFIARNFYCLSGTKDQHDWDKTNWVRTPLKAYADFKALSSMPTATLDVKSSVETQDTNHVVTLEVTNSSSVISLMTRFVLRNNKGDVIYPVFWDDNYTSILPGEQRTVQLTVNSSLTDNSSLFVSAWNMPESNVSLGW